jgi:hypothetical protein
MNGGERQAAEAERGEDEDEPERGEEAVVKKKGRQRARGVEERDNMMGETEGKVVRTGQRGQGRLEKGEGSTREGREWERGGEMREGSRKRKRGKGGVDEEKDDGRSRPCKGRKGGE